MSICPICGEEVAPRGANKAFPFCSARCKSIDLGKWLNEDYRVPEAPDEAGEGDESTLEPAAGGAAGEPPSTDDDSPPKRGMRH
jgi:endogenous inhibitor of DNA gyrase (YacG/DUF329 family)